MFLGVAEISRVKKKSLSRVKILCLLAKAQLVFQWCLYNKDMLFSKLESGYKLYIIQKGEAWGPQG